MKRLFFALIILVAAVSVALVALHDPGYLLISYGQWTVETTLSLAVLLLLLGFFLLYYLIRSLAGLRRLSGWMSEWRPRRREKSARAALTRGLLELAEGHWESAEKTLTRHAQHADSPLLNYLAAARAAQQQGAHERRDQYLRKAHDSMPSADVAVGLTQAELQIAHHQLEQALATLTHLRTIAPRHGYVLKMLMRLYVELRDWERLRELIPDLRKRGVVAGTELDLLETRVCAELLDAAARGQDLTALEQAWKQTPREVRNQAPVLAAYAQHLLALGAHDLAEPLLRDALKHGWNDELVRLYGLVRGPEPARQLAAAEGWLKSHGRNPMLLLALGRLSLQNKLWGKARAYLEASIGAGARPETYQELGGLLEQLKEAGAALDCYRKGAALALREEVEAPDASEREPARVAAVGAPPALSPPSATGS